MEEKMYFTPGELVTIRQDVPNKPVMLVIKKISNIIKAKETDKNLKGFLCRWFTKDGMLQECVFNTKDLQKYG